MQSRKKNSGLNYIKELIEKASIAYNAALSKRAQENLQTETTVNYDESQDQMLKVLAIYQQAYTACLLNATTKKYALYLTYSILATKVELAYIYPAKAREELERLKREIPTTTDSQSIFDYYYANAELKTLANNLKDLAIQKEHYQNFIVEKLAQILTNLSNPVTSVEDIENAINTALLEINEALLSMSSQDLSKKKNELIKSVTTDLNTFAENNNSERLKNFLQTKLQDFLKIHQNAPLKGKNNLVTVRKKSGTAKLTAASIVESKGENIIPTNHRQTTTYIQQILTPPVSNSTRVDGEQVQTKRKKIEGTVTLNKNAKHSYFNRVQQGFTIDAQGVWKANHGILDLYLNP